MNTFSNDIIRFEITVDGKHAIELELWVAWGYGIEKHAIVG
jgi:hypothetical protein